MWRILCQLIFDLAFYLPGVEHHLSALHSDAERRAARLFVWRRLFRNWRYWAVVAVVGWMAAVLLFLGIDQVSFAVQRTPPPWRVGRIDAVMFLIYGMLIALSLGILGMLPLRRIVRREMETFLKEQGYLLCRRCAYNLAGLAGPVCPECGFQTRHAERN